MRAVRQFNMTTKVKREWLLERLRENRERHQIAYAEALEGYRETAQKMLQTKLDKFKTKSYAKPININLSTPDDYTSVYDTVIGMLANNLDNEIVLQADEYRMFAEDEWDWMGSWLRANAGFSNTAMEYLSSKAW